MQTLRKVPLDNLQLQYEELADDINRATLEVWQSGKYVLTQGTQVKTFEAAFAAYIGTSHAMGVSSGTAALHLSLAALGIGSGDEVIVPANTYAATVFAISYTGATPVLVDVDPRTFTMDPTLVRTALTPRTKALLPVHLFGLPADMTRLMDIARDAGLAVVEDCAQAHGAEWQGKKVGSFGVAGCFSFYPTKNMHSLEGGMITTADAEFARKLRLLRNQGMEQRYQNEIVGANMRLTDVAAAIGRVQLGKLDGWTERRRANAAYLDERLRGVVVPPVAEGARHVYHQYTVRVPGDRDALQAALRERGVGSAVYYPTPIHRLKPYLSAEGTADAWKLPETDRAAGEVLSLPIFPTLTTEQLDHIVDAVNSAAVTA